MIRAMTMLCFVGPQLLVAASNKTRGRSKYFHVPSEEWRAVPSPPPKGYKGAYQGNCVLTLKPGAQVNIVRCPWRSGEECREKMVGHNGTVSSFNESINRWLVQFSSGKSYYYSETDLQPLAVFNRKRRGVIQKPFKRADKVLFRNDINGDWLWIEKEADAKGVHKFHGETQCGSYSQPWGHFYAHQSELIRCDAAIAGKQKNMDVRSGNVGINRDVRSMFESVCSKEVCNILSQKQGVPKGVGKTITSFLPKQGNYQYARQYAGNDSDDSDEDPVAEFPINVGFDVFLAHGIYHMGKPNFKWQCTPCKGAVKEFMNNKRIFYEAIQTIEVRGIKGWTAKQKLGRKIQRNLMDARDNRSASPNGKYLSIHGYGRHIKVHEFGNQYKGYRVEMLFVKEAPGKEYNLNIRFVHQGRPCFYIWLSNLKVNNSKKTVLKLKRKI